MKKLETRASNIDNFTLEILEIKPDNSPCLIDVISLKISLKDSEEKYEYLIRGDDRFTLNFLEINIPKNIEQAIEDLKKVKIDEDVKREYLNLYIGKSNLMQVTGNRIGRKKK